MYCTLSAKEKYLIFHAIKSPSQRFDYIISDKTATTAMLSCNRGESSFWPAPGATWTGDVELLEAEVSLGGSVEVVVVVGVTSVGRAVSVDSEDSVVEVEVSSAVLETSVVVEVVVASVGVIVGTLLMAVVVSTLGGIMLKEIVAPQRSSGVPFRQHPAFVQYVPELQYACSRKLLSYTNREAVRRLTSIWATNVSTRWVVAGWEGNTLGGSRSTRSGASVRWTNWNTNIYLTFHELLQCIERYKLAGCHGCSCISYIAK